MQGTILIIDGVATNRIMLKVQLSASYYRVVQADSVASALSVAQRCSPDLVLTAMSLPDGSATEVVASLASDTTLANIPVIAVSAQNDNASRIEALSAGIDDVLHQPLDDVILQARIRSLIRTRSSRDDLTLQHEAARTFEQPLTEQECLIEIRNSKVALVAHDAPTAAQWATRLQPLVPYHLHSHQIGDIQLLMTDPVPDVIVVELSENAVGPGLRLLADLRARAATRDSVVIAIPSPADAHVAAEALDRGAHDVLQSGFNVQELALRLSTQLRYKAHNDRLRASVRSGLRAAVEDPMTGLYNRRYATPFLDRVARNATDTNEHFALMLIDLDHFKRVNDHYGHPAGDAVLVETSNRLLKLLRPVDLLARVGGEEFMIVMPGLGEAQASEVSDRLCSEISGTPFQVPGVGKPIHLTTSIGLAIGGGNPCVGSAPSPLTNVTDLIADADRALYRAKDAGRNQVILSSAPAKGKADRKDRAAPIRASIKTSRRELFVRSQPA
ncbi:diguanylate cyclase response regulator [Sedimentitalea sp. CY04]|uniref:diguanylate cyclase n=1 Tax=Parasedimentitalea denitrificans TaxID=2211118 RepID=A0ABX0W2J7_9RHOB|nr:diguanylate cyclase response regulator [Sedimentitalea sp. CY04]